MIIEGDGFKFESVADEGLLFDVDVLKVINRGKSNERTELKNVAYGTSLSRAIEIVIMNNIDLKHSDKNLDLKTFLKEFKSERKKIFNLLK